MTNHLYTEVTADLGMIAPASQGNGSVTTGPYILDQLRRHIYTVYTGTVPGTVTIQLQASVDGLTNWQNIPGAVQVVTTANGIAQIEVRADRLNALNLGNYVQAVITVAGGSALVCVTVRGANPRYNLASDLNSTAVLPVVVI